MGDPQLILGGKFEGPLLVTGPSTVSGCRLRLQPAHRLWPVCTLPELGVCHPRLLVLPGRGLPTDSCPRGWGPSPLASSLPPGERHEGPCPVNELPQPAAACRSPSVGVPGLCVPAQCVGRWGHAHKQGRERVRVRPGCTLGLYVHKWGFRNMWEMRVQQRPACTFLCVISDVRGCPWGPLWDHNLWCTVGIQGLGGHHNPLRSWSCC